MKTLLLVFWLSASLVLGAVESVVVDSTTRDVNNTGVINYATGQLKVNDVVVVGGGGGGGSGGLVSSVNGQIGDVTIEVAPSVIVRHSSGTSTTYALAVNTDVARGDALKVAVPTLVTGDVLEIGAGTYNLGAAHLTFPDGTYTVRGAGHGVTIIISSEDTAHAKIKPGSGNTLQGFTINSDRNPIGWINGVSGVAQSTPITCNLTDIEANGTNDAFHFVSTVPTTLVMRDCIGASTYDVIAQAGAGGCNTTAYNTILTSNTVANGTTCRPLAISTGTIDFFGGAITGNYIGPGGTASSCVYAGNTVRLFDVKVRSTGVGQYDLFGDVTVSGGSGSGPGGSFTKSDGSTSYTGAAIRSTDVTFGALVATTIVGTSLTASLPSVISVVASPGNVVAGLTLSTPSVATAGNVVWSPGITQNGKAVRDSDHLSRTVSFRNYVVPVEGVDVEPTGYWTLEYKLGAGIFYDALKVFSGGTIQPAGGYLATDGTAGATASVGDLEFQNGLYISGSLSNDTSIVHTTGDETAAGVKTFSSAPVVSTLTANLPVYAGDDKEIITGVHGIDYNTWTPGTPASAVATGTAGDVQWDASFIYICIAANTWKRVAISTW